MTRTQRIVTVALAAIVAAIILLWTPAQEIRGQDNTPSVNTPPVIGTPTSTPSQYLFPRGEKAVLEFSSEPVTDTVWFVFTVPDISTPDNTDTTEVDEAGALFKVTRNGHNFEFTAKDGVTPEDFTALYGNVVSHSIPVKMYANDGNQDSLPLSFTITAYHDASPQFHHSATYQSKQRWDTDTVIEVYERPQVSKITDTLQIPWTSTTEGARTWTLGNPDGRVASPNIKCKDQSRTTTHTWDDQGSQDSALFSIDQPEENQQGHIALRFASPPDYEDAKDHDMDNEYLVRLVSRHDIHGVDGGSPTLGCDGSALDLKVRVKDVGPPAPPTGLTLTLDEYKMNQFRMNWDTPHANQFIENGIPKDFPDPSFNVNRLLIYHEPDGLQFDGNPILNPTQYYAITSGHQNIKGTPGVTYTITARLRNSEGLSDPVSAMITPLGPPAIPETPTVSPESETSIRVVWEEPNNNGGKPITGYEVQYQKDGADRWETSPHTGTGTSTIITSLVEMSEYHVKIKAKNELGSSDWSPTGKGRTVGLVVQITSSGNITSGNDAVFTVTLSKATTVTVNLTHTWTGGYGKSDPGTLDFTGETSKNYTLPTARGSPEAGGGSVTVTIAIDTNAAYEIGTSGSATVNIEQDPSSQPTLAPPSNQGSGAVYKFPAGKTDGIKYDSEPGTDLDGDTLAYLITFTNPETETDTEEEVTIPAEGTAADLPGTLFDHQEVRVHNFIFEPDGNVTPDQFEETYGTVTSHSEEKTLEVQLWASDGTERSHPVDFTLRLHYDPSGYFPQPAENRSISRWDLPGAIEISEGTNTLSGATVMWASPLAGTRNWATSNPTTPVSCRHGLADQDNTAWPATGNEDSDLFTLDTSTTTGYSGSITFSFKDPPDFESPSDSDKDNTYRLRLHNIHSLHQATGDQVGFPACSGSAIDITVIVINVNEPPKFPSETNDRSLTENTAEGQNIGAPFLATDPGHRRNPDLHAGRQRCCVLRHNRHIRPVADQSRPGP